MPGPTHLIIPDSHAHPDFHNKRYEWLGHLINDVKPDVVIDIGDWFDMPSLCSYDRGKKSFEGRRYQKDIEAGLDANDRMLSVVRRQKQSLPRFVRCLGNHENRISKAIESDPVLEGTIGIGDLQSEQFRWEVYPFLTPVDVDGVNYAHYFISGVLGKPIGGDNLARSILLKQLKSCTQGHSHLLDYCVRTSVDGKRIRGLSVGSFLDYEADWAGQVNKLWHNGVVICRDVQDGDYDMEHVSIERMKEEYKNA